MSRAPLIELTSVGRSYTGEGQETVALAGVSLEVWAGEFVAIVGPSGAGKSTLLNILGLLEEPTSGSYRFAGQETSTMTERDRDALRRRHFGFVFQSSHIIGADSVARNAALALSEADVPVAAQERIVGELLRRFGLTHRANQRGSVLSGGERQRLAIARATSLDPDLILADEPTGNLDTGNARIVMDHLRALNDEGTTVIVITHDGDIARRADRRISILDGRLHSSEPSISTTRADLVDIRPRPERHRSHLGNLLADTLSSMLTRLGQSALLALAFAIGATGIVCSVDLSLSAANQVQTRLSTAALDQVVVDVPQGWTDRHVDDAVAALRRLNDVERVGRRAVIASADAAITLLPLEGRSHYFGGQIYAEDSQAAAIDGFALAPAHAAWILNGSDEAAFVSDQAGRALGVSAVGPGESIWVGADRVPVSGVVMRGDDLRVVVLPYEFGEGLENAERQIVIRTRLGFPAAVADAVPFAVSPNDPADVQVETVADLRHLSRGVNADFTVFIAAIAAAILLLASFSAAATLSLNVASRTSEIALRRAVGASRGSIRMRFLIEGLLLGISGGVAGGAGGTLSALVLATASGWQPILSLPAICLAIAAGGLTGVASATLPSMRAARIEPAHAIRGA